MIIRTMTNSPEETMQLGNLIGQRVQSGDFVALFGDLGSGKTQITRGICQGLESPDDVTSPTFTLINEYNGRIPVYHFDFYRLDSDDAVFGLGYEEYFYGEGVCVVEWADRIERFLPKDRLDIVLHHQFDTDQEMNRAIEIRAHGLIIKSRDWHLLQPETSA